jgi:hypothetical protein
MAALAAGVATSMAQNVYSLNIVGYANVPTPVGYSFQSNPFNSGVTNGGNEVLAISDDSQVLIWQSVSFKTYVMDSTSPSGFANTGGSPIDAPLLTNGVGYLYYNASGVSNNNTYVGTVRTGTNTLSLRSSPPFSAVGSPIPYAGGVKTVLGLNGGDDSQIQLLKTNPGGAITGFDIYVYDSSQVSGFATTGGAPKAEPVVAVGAGFFFQNATGAPVPWVQILNP